MIPPKGDENFAALRTLVDVIDLIMIPPKGDENCPLSFLIVILFGFDNDSPERGREPVFSSFVISRILI